MAAERGRQSMKSSTCQPYPVLLRVFEISDGSGACPSAMTPETSAKWESSAVGRRGGTLCVPPRWLRTHRPETRALPSPSGSPATEDTPEVHGICDSRRLAKAGRWESLGKRQGSKGGRSRSASVVSSDGQAWGSGVRQHRAARRLGRLSRRNRATATTAGSLVSDARRPKREAAHPVGRRMAATARTAAATDRPAVRSPLSVLRTEKSRGTFIATGIALMIAAV